MCRKVYKNIEKSFFKVIIKGCEREFLPERAFLFQWASCSGMGPKQ
jgi:hypothetical protein